MRIDPRKLIIAMYDKDMNTKRLAELSGVSRPTISSIKCGKSCSDETGNKIVRALGVKPETLLEEA